MEVTIKLKFDADLSKESAAQRKEAVCEAVLKAVGSIQRLGVSEHTARSLDLYGSDFTTYESGCRVFLEAFPKR